MEQGKHKECKRQERPREDQSLDRDVGRKEAGVGRAGWIFIPHLQYPVPHGWSSLHLTKHTGFLLWASKSIC